MDLSHRNFYQSIYKDGELYHKGARLFGKRIALIDWDEIRGKTVLDLGCNNGVMAVEAARHGAQWVLGVDNAPCIDMAREVATAHGLTNIGFEQSNIESPEFKCNTPMFDVVFFFAMLNHMRDKPGMLRWIDDHARDILYYETNFENPVSKHLPLLKSYTAFAHYYYLGESEEIKPNSYHLIKCTRTN